MCVKNNLVLLWVICLLCTVVMAACEVVLVSLSTSVLTKIVVRWLYKCVRQRISLMTRVSIPAHVKLFRNPFIKNCAE